MIFDEVNQDYTVKNAYFRQELDDGPCRRRSPKGVHYPRFDFGSGVYFVRLHFPQEFVCVPCRFPLPPPLPTRSTFVSTSSHQFVCVWYCFT